MAQFSNGEGGASVRTKINAAIGTVDGLGTGDSLLLTAAERTKIEGIEPQATADMTGLEIVGALDAEIGTDWKTGGASGAAWGGITGTLADQTDLATALDGKVTQAQVDAAIAALVDSSPTTLDTLNELAAALGDDPDYAATTAAQIGLKANTADLGTAATSNAADFATAAQGALAGSAVQPSPDAGNNLSAGAKVWEGTQAAYDAIATKDSNTIYYVAG